MENKDRAIEIVVKFEKKHGRKPIVLPNGHGYDVHSGNRRIEVKSKGRDLKHSCGVSMHESLYRKIWKFGKRYYIYFVYNMNDRPKMKIIEPKQIFPNLRIENSYHLDGKFLRDRSIPEIDVEGEGLE
jgi:hypothetical protein